MALSFSQGLLSSLTNPNFNLTGVGQQIGGLGGQMRANKQAEAEKQRMAQMAALEAAGQGATEAAAQNRQGLQRSLLGDLGSTVSPELAAIQQGAALQAGIKPADVAAARGIGETEKQRQAWNRYLTSLNRADLIGLPVDVAKDALQNKDKKPITVSAGAVVIDKEGNVVYDNSALKEGKTFRQEMVDLASTGKYTPASLEIAAATGKLSDLVPRTESERVTGKVSATVEKNYNGIVANATTAAADLVRNRQLQQSMLANPGKSSGIVSDIRTTALGVAGLRDAEEEEKTAFLRARNASVVAALPPGVATDRDIVEFKKGFPPDNASSEEVLRYLRGEEKALAATADLAVLADAHLQRQINSGGDATMLGFIAKKENYGSAMNIAQQRISAARAAGDVNAEQQEIRLLTEALGFTPKIYQ